MVVGRGRTIWAVLALALLAGSLWLVESARAPTSYAALGWAPATATAIAASVLVTSGLAAWWIGIPGAIGGLAVALGVVWCAPLWVGWEAGPAWVRSVAMLVAPFAPAVLLHMGAVTWDGRSMRRPARWLVLAGYGVTSVYTIVRALVRDPFRDLYCWSNCTDNVFLLVPDPGLARWLDDLWVLVVLLIASSAGVLAVGQLTRGRRMLRAPAGPISVAVLAVSLAEVATAAHLLTDRWERPSAAASMSLFLVRAATCTALGLTIDLAVWRTWRARAAVARLSSDLARAPAAGSLEQGLSAVLGDQHLSVAYPVAVGGLVSADGRPAAPPHPGQVTTTLERGGEVVALVRHAPSIMAPDELADRIGAAARLAVDNERMRATLLAQVEQLKASRARVVATSDAERRRLERDLHDGAQQRLLALTYELRMARADAEANGDPDRAAALTTALEQAQAAVAELRAIAHGIHPATLTEAGLGPALLWLADAATIPVEVLALPDERFPEAAERAAYQAVARAIERAEQGALDHLQVSTSREGDRLVVYLQPPGDMTAEWDVIDRIGALGGDLRIDEGILRVEVPCA